MEGVWWVGLVCKDVRNYPFVLVRWDGDSVSGGVGDRVRVMGGGSW